MSTCCGAITSASAMSGVVSDTRLIWASVFNTTDFPTGSSISFTAVAAKPPGAPLRAVSFCACGVTTMMMMMNTTVR